MSAREDPPGPHSETLAVSRAPVSRKRRLASIFLIAFALWPAVQYGLVEFYGVNAWKLVGWAMYSVPGPMKSMHLAVEGADGSLTPILPDRYSEAEQIAHRDYFEHRSALGGLADAGPLAEAFASRLGPGEQLFAALGSLYLDRETALVALDMRTVRIDAEGRLHPVPLPARPDASESGP